MENLDFDVGTGDMSCNCGNSIYTDIIIGRVLTGNLSIIKDRKLRKLIEKGPSYREQNNINWNTNLKNSVSAIKGYKIEWAKREPAPCTNFSCEGLVHETNDHPPPGPGHMFKMVSLASDYPPPPPGLGGKAHVHSMHNKPQVTYHAPQLIHSYPTCTNNCQHMQI